MGPGAVLLGPRRSPRRERRGLKPLRAPLRVPGRRMTVCLGPSAAPEGAAAGGQPLPGGDE